MGAIWVQELQVLKGDPCQFETLIFKLTCPGSSSAARTSGLFSKQRMVTAGPQNLVIPPKSLVQAGKKHTLGLADRSMSCSVVKGQE